MKKKSLLFSAAFAIAVLSAFAFKPAGSTNLTGVPAYYFPSSGVCSTTTINTEQNDCDISNMNGNCTVLVSGSHLNAFQNSDCTGQLKRK